MDDQILRIIKSVFDVEIWYKSANSILTAIFLQIRNPKRVYFLCLNKFDLMRKNYTMPDSFYFFVICTFINVISILIILDLIVSNVNVDIFKTKNFLSNHYLSIISLSFIFYFLIRVYVDICKKHLDENKKIIKKLRIRNYKDMILIHYGFFLLNNAIIWAIIFCAISIFYNYNYIGIKYYTILIIIVLFVYIFTLVVRIRASRAILYAIKITTNMSYKTLFFGYGFLGNLKVYSITIVLTLIYGIILNYPIFILISLFIW